MSIIYNERPSDAPYISTYVQTITQGWTTGAASTIRPAECHWHMVFVKYNGDTKLFVVGPLTSSGVVSWTEGAEVLWVKFRLGTFMPHLSPRNCLNLETSLPQAADRSFWLKGAAWQFPNYENIDTFVNKLVREEVLVCDPVVNAVLQGQTHDVSSRTVRHRFLQTTGLSQNHIHQIERAQQAARLLQQGKSILDTVDEAGYFDQPHLTRSLKHWVGHTPAQIVKLNVAG